MKIVLKSLCLLLILFCVVLLFEAGIYYRILNKKQLISPSDAVIVFHGSPTRNEEGYRLVNEGLAPVLIVSPASIDTQKKYDDIYGYTGAWQHLTEDRADTTFQNAILTSRLIRKHKFNKVILVTDSWHMPRSYLLLRMMLTGSHVEILPNEIDAETFIGSPLKWSSHEKKLMYNELVEFWGSMCEMGLYFVQGKLPENSLKEKAWVKTLRSAILLDV